MKNAAVHDPTYADSSMAMHTKQLAEYWKVDARSLTNWIAKCRKLGYEIGQPGERNRTYFSDVDQDLINTCRHGTLTPNPRKAEASQNDSENVLSMDERRNRETQEAQTEAGQNRNLQLRSEVVQSSGELLPLREQAARLEGGAIAKAELSAKLQGYLETRVACDQAFHEFINELNSADVSIEPVDQPALPESISPKQLLAALF